MSVEFTVDMEPDEHGVYDGRELAHELMAFAYELLAPYVEGCPVCTSTLFSVIAKGTIKDLHQDAVWRRHFSGKLMNTGFNTEEGEAAVKAHLGAARMETVLLLGLSDKRHQH